MKPNIINVSVIVVTYNRKALLMECLEALNRQTYPIQKIILIDNASTDGTKEEVEASRYNNIDYVLMDKNTGGAGGFYRGLEKAKEEDCDWIWVMDDDTIPDISSLEKLIDGIHKIENHSNESISFIASAVYGPNGEYMNVPNISRRQSENGYSGWYRMLNEGIVCVDSATFVSILIKRDAVMKCGLPCKDYFIWGDDIEYTSRLTKFYGTGYFTGQSFVIHKRFNAKKLDIVFEDNQSRLMLYHYLYRNQAINDMFYNNKRKFTTLLRGIKESLRVLSGSGGIKRAFIVLKGYIEAMVEYRRFKDYIQNQISNKVNVHVAND